MKVTLVVPGSRAAVENARYRELFPQLLPMSVAYLAAALEQDGVSVRIIDQVPAHMPNELLVQELQQDPPDILGISLLTTTVANALDLIELVRRTLPEVKILLGNQHATLFAEELLHNGVADLIVRGEGEVTIREVVAALDSGGDFSAVAGLSYRQGEQVHHNPDRPLIQDLDSLAWPAWHHVDLFNRAYMELPVIGVYSTPLAMMASRGCPYDCIFCSQDKQYKKVRLRKVTSVVDEIEYHADRYGLEWFTFNDAYFPWNKRQGMAFADEIIRRNLHQRIRWTTESRVDQVDDELMKRLRKAGLEVIFFGFESGNQAILDRAGKRTTLAQARAAARATHNAGIKLMGFFMLGLPGETPKSAWETIRFAMELDCDFAKFAITIPYPGSRLYDLLRDEIDASQFEKFTSWSDWADDDPGLLYSPDEITSAQLVAIQRAGMLRFYARPTMVWRHLRWGTMRPRDMALGAQVLLGGAARNVVDRARSLLPHS